MAIANMIVDGSSTIPALLSIAFGSWLLGTTINLGSALLLVALGVWVAMRGPPTPAARALAWFAGLFGSAYALQNSYDFLPCCSAGVDWLDVISSVLLLLTVPFLERVARLFPRPLAPTSRLRLVTWGFVATVAILWWPNRILTGELTGVNSLVENSQGLGKELFLAACWGAGIVFAFRFAQSSNPADRRLCALLALALAIFPCYQTGYRMQRYGFDAADPLSYFGLLVFGGFGPILLLAALWLRNTIKSWRPESTIARNRALAILAIPLVAAALSRVLGGADVADYEYGLPGLARFGTLILFAYGILRHDMLAFDMKARIAVRRSTIAAAFLGVFFVATEFAQQIFTASWGPWLGIAAAGLLVFAFEPLQRVANRVAAAAVPRAKAVGSMEPTEREATYLRLAEAAWSDGHIDRRDRIFLDASRDSLGLNDATIARLEREAFERAPASRPRNKAGLGN